MVLLFWKGATAARSSRAAISFPHYSSAIPKSIGEKGVLVHIGWKRWYLPNLIGLVSCLTKVSHVMIEQSLCSFLFFRTGFAQR